MADVASVKSTGIAWVSFSNPEDAAAATAKHKQMMGQRYIEILPAASSGACARFVYCEFVRLPWIVSVLCSL